MAKERRPDSGRERPSRIKPEVRGGIAQMESLMENPLNNHSGIPFNVAVSLWERGVISSLADFEAALREMGSRVNFFAIPKDQYSVGVRQSITDTGAIVLGAMPALMSDYQVVYPRGVVGEPNYWLWVGVHGRDEAEKKREELMLTEKENMNRLRTTGFLSLRKK